MNKLSIFLSLLLGFAVLFAVAANAEEEPAAAEEEFTFEKKQLSDLAKQLKGMFDAMTVGDRIKEVAAKDAFLEELDSIGKKNEVDNILKYTNQLYKLKESTIDTTDRIIKAKAGQGFQENTFEDLTEGEINYKYFISIPKGYAPDAEERFPVVIYLHSSTGTDSKQRLLKAVKDELRQVFIDDALLDKAIIIAPIGPEEGRKKILNAAEDWTKLDPGRKTAFTAIRVFLEKMVFDRGRVFVFGFGKNGLSAFRYATWYPSLFSGAVAVNAPLEPLFIENARDMNFLYLNLPENDKAAAEKASEWAQTYNGKEGGPKVILVEDSEAPGKKSRLTAKCIEALHAFVDRDPKNTAPERIFLKSINLEFSSNSWLQIQVMNNTAEMKVEDEDIPYIDASVDRATNTFDIKTNRIGAFRIFLSDKLVDMDKKITVTLNGDKRWEGTKERNVRLFLRMLYENWAGDYEVYTNFIDIEE